MSHAEPGQPPTHNPEQWNDWKDKLLGELYNKTAALINIGLDQQGDKESNISEIQTASLRRLELMGIDSHQANDLWQTFSNDYFQSHTYGQITWHTALILEARNNSDNEDGKLDNPLIQTRVHESSNSIQLVIYMKDRDYIFYDVATVLNRCAVAIVNAQILNTSDGNALQSFRLAPENTDSSEMPFIAQDIVEQLRESLSNDNDTKAATMSGSSKHKYFSSPTVISFKDIPDNETTLISIETIDRSGVLQKISKTFIDSRIRLLNARITTAGEKAIDHFSIGTSDDKMLSKSQKETLKQQLKEIL